jgi:hypothetical protein
MNEPYSYFEISKERLTGFQNSREFELWKQIQLKGFLDNEIDCTSFKILF